MFPRELPCVRCSVALVVVNMLCNIGTNPLLAKCCLQAPGAEEFTLISTSDDYFEIQRTEAVLVMRQPSGEAEIQALAVSENLPKDEQWAMPYKIQEERNSPTVVQVEPLRSSMPLSMTPVKEGFIPTRLEEYTEKLKEYPARGKPMGSVGSFEALLTPMKQPTEEILISRSGLMVPAPENVTCVPGRSPRGDYVLCEAADLGNVTSHELMGLEQMVSKMAGSPLGCIDFGNTFRWKHQNNEIITLRGHSLDGMPFGEVCAKYQSITMLALKFADGRLMWAPAPHVRLHSSDQILLIECAPFVIAKGLGQEASLSLSSLATLHAAFSGAEAQDTFKPRRCCGV